MGFFVNRAFNLVYVHAALQAFASYGGEAFAFVYLLKAGIPAHVVLLAIAAMFGSRILFRWLVLPLVHRVGLRRALILAILAEASTYPVLSQIDEVGTLFVVYLILWSISSSIYWTTYHAYVALLGDNHLRGAQVSAVEFIGIIMGIVAPGLTGALLTLFNPLVAFSVVGVAMALSAIPVLLGPDPQVAREAQMRASTRRQARLLMFTDGLRSGAFHFTWLIALFITLGSNFAAFGGAMSLAGLGGALAALFLGRLIDLGKGLRAARIGFATLAVAAAARTIAYPDPVLALGANVLAAAAWPLYATAFNSRVYILARESACPLRFHVVAEGGWDMGTCLACLLAAAMIGSGMSYHVPLAVGLLACGLGYLVVAGTFVNRPG